MTLSERWKSQHNVHISKIIVVVHKPITAWTLFTVQSLKEQKSCLAAVMQFFIDFHQGPPRTIWLEPRRPLH